MDIQHYLQKKNLSPIVSVEGNGIIPLSKEQYEEIRPITTAQTRLKPGQRTKAHVHKETSFYLVKGLALELYKNVVELPQQALVIIKPGVEHPWIAHTSGEVCDVPANFVHKPHIVL
ncbi:hypothetical protein H6776_00360 [Candidatus Nomurabacteria bacterium]|nr:hypothetical protein [Candidatus Nomurabacteria bacterium]